MLTTHRAVRRVEVERLRPDVPPGPLMLCESCRGEPSRTWRWRWRSLSPDLAPDFPAPRRSTPRVSGADLHGARKADGVQP